MTDKKENKEWDNRELGALWVNVKQSDGSKYLTGTINGEKVIVFKNKYKDENEKAQTSVCISSNHRSKIPPILLKFKKKSLFNV